MINLSLWVYLLPLILVIGTWAISVFLYKKKWRIITGRMALLLVVVALALHFIAR